MLDQKPLVYLWRPIYRALFIGIVWPFIGRVKQFFFAETSRDLAELRRSVAVLEAQMGQLTAIVNESKAREAEQAKQWQATRALLLSLFSNSAYPALDSTSPPQSGRAQRRQ